MKIIQLVNGYSKGDGVGNVITAIDKLLKSKGYFTEIYNQTLCLNDLSNPELNGENIVLYHVALSVDPIVKYLKCKKVLVFHNITDPELLIGAGLQQMRILCSAGLYDVRGLSGYFESAIVFSDYSKATLIKGGWETERIYQMPIMVRFDNLSQAYDERLVEKYSDGYTNIIFTGRVFPNKKQEDIIRSFDEYKKKYNEKSRLFIVGSLSNRNYFNALKKLVIELGLANDVIFTGRVPFEQYIAYYKLANVFLCMSAHEGFCIPVVEALYFGIPIIAVNATAVPDTLGGSGLLLDNRDSNKTAEAINKVVTDKTYRKILLEGEKKRLDELMPERVENLYLQVLEKCLSNKDMPKYKDMEEGRVLSDQIALPEAFEMHSVVIYGFGASGNRLFEHLKNYGIKVEAICDQNKAGETIRQVVVISPAEAFKNFKDSYFVISIQDKRIIKTVICLMRDNGIKVENIFIFDEIKEEVM